MVKTWFWGVPDSKICTKCSRNDTVISAGVNLFEMDWNFLSPSSIRFILTTTKNQWELQMNEKMKICSNESPSCYTFLAGGRSYVRAIFSSSSMYLNEAQLWTKPSYTLWIKSHHDKPKHYVASALPKVIQTRNTTSISVNGRYVWYGLSCTACHGTIAIKPFL